MKNQYCSLPLSVQVFYGIGVSYAIIDQIFAQWILFYYLPPSGAGLNPIISPLFLSISLIFCRFIDMVADPAVGYYSDKTDTKWGRRRPFIAIGAVPLAISTIAFFFPVRGDTDVYAFFFLSIVGSLFFIFYTLVSGPYNALIPEISRSHVDRLNLSTWQSVFRLIFTAIAMISPGILIHVLGRGDTEKGIRYMVILLSMTALFGMIISVMYIDERKYSGGKTSNTDIFPAIKAVLKDKPFQIYLIGFLFFFIGFNILRASMNYYVVDIMGYGKGMITVASALLFGVSAISFYPVNLLSRKHGYKPLMVVSLFLLFLCSLFIYFLGRFFPVQFGFIIFAFAGVPLAGAAFIFPPAMLSEISAVSAKESGDQLEGMYFGIQGFFLKMAFLISIALLPVVLVIGSELPFWESLITRPEGVERSGIYYTCIISGICFLASAVFYIIYPEKIADN